ncbi:MAG: hypothetical protein R6T89_02490 [Candidatus Syntrophosphaera sp.]
MRKLCYLCVIPFLMLGLFACSEKDDITDVDILGYRLDQFIDADSVRNVVDPEAEATQDFRSLFAYEIVSSEDGFSPRMSSNAGYDLPWNIFSGGYLVPSDNFTPWFPDAQLPGAFGVDNTGLFRLYRKVDVNSGIRGSKLVELRGLQIHEIENWDAVLEDAVKLSDLLQSIADYDSVGFMAADGYSMNYQEDLINDGYYLLDSEVTTFPNYNDLLPGGTKKFKKLSSVEVYGATSDQTHDFDLAPEEDADIEFTVPDDLSGFASTVMTE